MTTGARQMIRNILAIVLGLVAFMLAASLCGVLLRLWPDWFKSSPPQPISLLQPQ